MTIKDTNFWLNEAELKTPEHDKMVLWTFNNAEKIINDSSIEINPKDNIDPNYLQENINPIIRSKKILEYPLKSYNNFILGYIDLMIEFNIEKGYFQHFDNGSNSPLRKQFIAFEVKPEVKSIGEVLRQFQYYKSSSPPLTDLVLVTKTIGLKEIFESQGFYVYEYKEEDKNVEQICKEV